MRENSFQQVFVKHCLNSVLITVRDSATLAKLETFITRKVKPTSVLFKYNTVMFRFKYYRD